MIALPLPRSSAAAAPTALSSHLDHRYATLASLLLDHPAPPRILQVGSSSHVTRHTTHHPSPVIRHPSYDSHHKLQATSRLLRQQLHLPLPTALLSCNPSCHWPKNCRTPLVSIQRHFTLSMEPCFCLLPVTSPCRRWRQGAVAAAARRPPPIHRHWQFTC